MTLDFAIICPLVRPGRPLYPVLVHRAAALLYASFGPRLATTPLRFANPSPPSGWIEDSHLQAVDHARHTNETGTGMARPRMSLKDCRDRSAERHRDEPGRGPRGLDPHQHDVAACLVRGYQRVAHVGRL